MNDIKFVFAGEGTELQNDSVPMLARCFEEWQIFQAAYGNVFPFREISFAALNENDEIVGHVGIMPFDVLNGKGGVVRMAGIASVGTAPEYRGCGIAARLCNDAAEWAKDNGFDCMPLYTSFNRVYESCGWRNYPVKSVALTNGRAELKKGRKGAELTENEREFIIECYNKIPEFAGKVLRTRDKSFHGWNRIFRETFFDWYVDSNGYAVAFEEVLAEFFALNGDASGLVCGIGSAFLSENFTGMQSLLDNGWRISAADKELDCWHGENVMCRCLNAVEEKLFYSLTDKF